MKFLLTPPALEDVLATIEFHRGKPYVTDAVLDFHCEIVLAQDRNAVGYRTIAAYLPRETEDLQTKLDTGFCLVDPPRIRVERTLSGDLYDEIGSICQTHGTLTASQVGRLHALRTEGRIDVSGLVLRIIEQDASYFETLGAAVAVNPSVIVWLAERLAQPVLARIAGDLSPVMEVEGSGRTTCPICGNEPVFSLLSEADEGKRFLQCSLCHARWEHARLECPFCRNDEQQNLEYLFYDDDSAYRVNVCKLCRRYLKAIDERACTDRNPVLWMEALLTPYLDEMALAKGYLRTPS